MNPQAVDSLDKLINTADSVRAEIEKLAKVDGKDLNMIEERIRQELQVIQALPDFIGQEIYAKVQARRHEIKLQRAEEIRKIAKEGK